MVLGRVAPDIFFFKSVKPHGHFFAKNKFSEASRLPYGRFFLFGVIRIITCAVRTDSPPTRAIFAFRNEKIIVRGGSPLLGLYVS